MPDYRGISFPGVTYVQSCTTATAYQASFTREGRTMEQTFIMKEVLTTFCESKIPLMVLLWILTNFTIQLKGLK